MRVININLSELSMKTLDIGYVGESHHVVVYIHCASFFKAYPDATASMVAEPPEGDLYPVAIERDNSALVWVVSDGDLAYPGSGKFQLTFTQDEEVIKTAYGSYTVSASMGETGDPPAPVDSWIKKAEQTARQIAEESAIYAKEEIVESYGSIAPAIIETASGAIASFSDGADGMLVKTLTVDIAPVQDLHGYDSPWPAGGGANKISFFSNETQNGVTLTNNNGVITLNGTATAVCRFDLTLETQIPAGSYYVSFFNDAMPGVEFIMLNSGGSGVSDIVLTSANYGSAITLGSDVVKLRIYIANGTSISRKKISPMLVSGSTAPTSFTPYSNLCPISGWTEANVSRTGKNLLDITDVEFEGWYNADGTKELSNSYNCYLVSAKPETTYTISGNFAGIITYWDSGLNFISGTNQGSGVSKTFTTPANCAYIRRSILKTNIDGTQQLELGSTATTYKPYSGTTAEYEFPQAAKPVYGGSLTINQDGTGTLVADRADVDLGTLTWTKIKTSGSHWRFWAYLNTADAGQELLCSHYKWISGSEQYLGMQGIATQTSGTNVIVMASDEAYSDASSFKTAMSGVKLVYELATPVTYQLTNQQVIALLKGANNVWADCGAVTLEYPADTKLYIDGKVAELQALILENISNS